MVNWAAVDLNLLRVFDAMMIELNTTRAGERVGLSQPAVSSALGRLRHIVGDALFVREGNRMVPTTRAEQLSGSIRTALREIEDALGSVADFNPATDQQVFRILGSDYFSTLLMPRLAGAVGERAPGLTLQMLDHPSSSAVRLMSEGAVDMAVDSASTMPDWVSSQLLYHSVMVTVARRGHPVIAHAELRPGERIPPDLFCALPQVLMSMDGSRSGSVDKPLNAKGFERRVALTVPHFHAFAIAVAETDLIGNLPEHFAARVAAKMDLEIYQMPFPPPPIAVMLYWHSRHQTNRAHEWLRTAIRQALVFP